MYKVRTLLNSIIYDSSGMNLIEIKRGVHSMCRDTREIGVTACPGESNQSLGGWRAKLSVYK
jgi:hypothetical protein